jgi:AcrR family transcriptional regulator
MKNARNINKITTGAEGSKREEIIQFASRLFSLKGYNATSLQDIAAEVGLHKTSLFHYFKNKEEILMEVMEISFKEYTDILNDSVKNGTISAEEKFRLALEEQVSVICKYKHYINVALNEIKSLTPENRGKYTRTRNDYGKHFEKIIREVQADEKSSLFKGIDQKIITLGILGMCNWIIKWYRKDGPLTPKEISDIFFKMITEIGNKATV